MSIISNELVELTVLSMAAEESGLKVTDILDEETRVKLYEKLDAEYPEDADDYIRDEIKNRIISLIHQILKEDK